MRQMIFLLMVLSARPLLAQTVEDQVREMRMEIQRLRQELDEVKQELRNRNESIETVPLIQAQIQEQAQTKVESSSRFPVKIFGTLVSNTFWNNREVNWLDIPNIVEVPRPGLRPGSFSSALRQSRIGAIFEGPEVKGMKLNGALEADFYGGIPNFQTGQAMGLPRLVYGYVRLDGDKTAFEIGQDQMILAPKNPTSLMALAFPSMYRSGNLYLRAPQIRAERLIASGDFGQIRLVGGALAPIAGDFSTGSYQFVPPNLAGERSRMPALQTRLSWRATPAGPGEAPQWEFGVSQHYARDRFPNGVVSSWATAADFDATSGKFGVGGELFTGQNLQAFGGSIGQAAKSRGGFVEGRFSATRRLSFNTGYGTDRLRDLAGFPPPLRGNGTYFANSIYNFTPEFRAAFEYQRLSTKPTDGSTRTNNHLNLTFAYTF